LGLWVNAGTPVHVAKARLKSCPVIIKRTVYSCGLAAMVLLCGGRALQNAIAEGDTRTISLHHIHTDEDITITFKRDGRYDEAALNKLNWFLRDWRKQQETKMDPHLIDLIWEVHREAGSNQPVWVVCGYRSPETNAMLRHRSAGVARFSQHMLGHAMDFYIPGVPLDQLRAVGLRLQRGGVGFYPTSGSPFVHMDTGGVRMWPRMTREQLVRVFPDQRTVYLPADGRPLAGYELALADIKKRGDGTEVGPNVADAGEGSRVNPFAKLLHMARGNSDEEDADAAPSAPAPAATEPLHSRAKAAVTAAVGRVEDKLAAEKTKLAEAAAKAGDKLAAEKAKLAQAASSAETKLAAEKTKLAKIAGQAHVISRAEAAPMAATPNQVILARGFWEGVPDGMPVARSAPGAIAEVTRPSRLEVANADPTGSVPAFANVQDNVQDDRVAPEVALAYAEQPGREWSDRSLALPQPTGTEALRAAMIHAAAAQTGDNATTIAVKRVGGRTASVVFTVSTKKVSPVLADTTRLSDPWLRAIMVSPSVSRFLCITALGTRDFRTLAELMVKPANTVLMTFAAEPNPGLDTDSFGGSAVVFIPTVSYTLRTAQLQ
jgi:uncharacterized protein YcbK (DUF882 family)